MGGVEVLKRRLSWLLPSESGCVWEQLGHWCWIHLRGRQHLPGGCLVLGASRCVSWVSLSPEWD